jgi:hypothetical protein
VSSYFHHYPRHGQCLEELPYIFLRGPQLSFGQRFSLQTKNAVQLTLSDGMRRSIPDHGWR